MLQLVRESSSIDLRRFKDVGNRCVRRRLRAREWQRVRDLEQQVLFLTAQVGSLEAQVQFQLEKLVEHRRAISRSFEYVGATSTRVHRRPMGDRPVSD